MTANLYSFSLLSMFPLFHVYSSTSPKAAQQLSAWLWMWPDYNYSHLCFQDPRWHSVCNVVFPSHQKGAPRLELGMVG